MGRNQCANVLLTYGWVRSSYAAMRNLTSHGISTWVSDSGRVGMSQWSRLKAGSSLYTPHYVDEQAFVADVVRLASSLRVRYVLPSHNETEVLARYRDLLPSGTDRFLPDAEHCRTFNNKARAYELASSLGLSVPKRVPAYERADDVAELMQEAGMSRVVIKLLTGNSAKGVYYATAASEATRIVERLIRQYDLSPDRYPQVEEYVEGEGAGCSVLYWDGARVADFQHRRLREKTTTGGTSTLREVMSHEAMRVDARRLMEGIGWHGLAMVEFKVCPMTGRHWFIEVNPRMWGSIPFAISAGAEFPYLAWLCATEGIEAARHFDRHRKASWRGRWLLGDMILAASQVSKLQLRDACRTLWRADADSVDDFHWDDVGSFLGEVAYYGSKFLKTRSMNPEDVGMVG